MYIPGLVCLVLAATVKAFHKKQKNNWQACPKMIKSIDSVRRIYTGFLMNVTLRCQLVESLLDCRRAEPEHWSLASVFN